MAISSDLKLKMYRSMLLIRRFEERVNDCFLAGKIPGFIHSYLGEEAVATGACINLAPEDKVCSHHRGDGHVLAKGSDPKALMAELFGRSTGLAGGRCGQMHVTDPENGLVCCNGLVGGAMPLAVGAAYSCKIKENGVAIGFIGDGGSARGTAHEAMYLAAAKKLPLIMIIENNYIAGSTRPEVIQPVEHLYERCAAYGVPGCTIDGNNVEEVYEEVQKAIARAKAGEGPSIIECRTWRHDGHFVGDPGWGKTDEEQAEWLKKDPVVTYKARLIAEGVATQAQLDEIENEVMAVVDEAEQFAENSPFPVEEDMMRNVFVD